MIWALKLLGIGKAILGWLKSGLRWCLSDWRHAVIVALGVATLIFHLSSNKWQARAEKAFATVEARDRTIADFKEAQEKATLFAKAEKARIEALNERKADEARDLEKKLRSDYDARLAGWLRSQDRRATGKAYLSCPAPSTEGTAGESAAADIPANFALVPVSDLELSAQAFAKLEALQAWAKQTSE